MFAGSGLNSTPYSLPAYNMSTPFGYNPMMPGVSQPAYNPFAQPTMYQNPVMQMWGLSGGNLFNDNLFAMTPLANYGGSTANIWHGSVFGQPNAQQNWGLNWQNYTVQPTSIVGYKPSKLDKQASGPMDFSGWMSQMTSSFSQWFIDRAANSDETDTGDWTEDGDTSINELDTSDDTTETSDWTEV